MAQREAFTMLNKILEASHTKKKRRSITLDYFIEEFMLGLGCFLIGRAVLLAGLAPFGPVLFAVLLYKRYGGITAFIGVALGLFTTGLGGLPLKYGFVMIFFTLSWFIATKKNMRWSTFKAASLVFLCMALVNGIFYIRNGLLTYELLMGFLESVIGFVMVFIFSRAVDVIKEQRRRRILSSEEIISISIVISLLIIGFWSKDILGISLRSVFSIFTVILAAALGGPGIGASIGVTLGFMLSLTSSPDPVLMANLAACGLLAGTFKELGRAGSCLAFILTNSLMTYYINRSTFAILPFSEILIAAIFLLLLPKRFISYLKQFLDYTHVKTRNQHYYVNRMQELIVGRLSEFSQVFRHLSVVFARMTDKGSDSGKEELSKLFDLIAQQVCSSCPLYRSCWQRDFHNTYSNMFDMLTICEVRGYIEGDEVPEALARKCLNPDSLIDTINSVYAAYR
ncbi:MAG TPA: hypothetical protein VFD33_02575, partial [Bacillota bacterium]|nr:hypothetical protein [Bacillota bacterium]